MNIFTIRAFHWVWLASLAGLGEGQAARWHVETWGKDSNTGTVEAPLASPLEALRRAKAIRGERPGEPLEIVLGGGDYYLDGQTLRLDETVGGTAETPTRMTGQGGNATRVHAGSRLKGLQWKQDAERPGVWKAAIGSGRKFEQLYLEGKRLVLARYPDWKPSGEVFGGYFQDWKLPRERVAAWQPAPGIWVHGMHAKDWGSVHFAVRPGSQPGEVELDGGWQINRPSRAKLAMVEGALSELDAGGEWAYTPDTGELYYLPADGKRPPAEGFSHDGASRILVLEGTGGRKLEHVEIRGMSLAGSGRTFMRTREPLLLGDWCLAREGAVFVENCADIRLTGLRILNGGGTGILFSGYNRGNRVSRTEIRDMGGGGIYFVGRPEAVRSPRFEYGAPSRWEGLDRTPGPKGEQYPAECAVEDCYIHDLGIWEKQVAALHVSMAKGITLKHNSMHSMPRAAINVNDGCWGGHQICHNDAWDTVQETGDHGTFNSWGRDRYWQLDGTWHEVKGDMLEKVRSIALLDAVSPIRLANNRFDYRGHEYGWGIDLDDGSSNYVIEDNLVTAGGIKLREGFFREVRNNIVVDDSVHAHVWYEKSGDTIHGNIFGANGYSNIQAPMQLSGAKIGKNAFATASSHTLDQFYPLAQAQKDGIDGDSIVVDAKFAAPGDGDYRLLNAGSFAAIGFRPFAQEFGVRDEEFARRAREHRAAFLRAVPRARVARAYRGEIWGAEISDIDAGLRSAAGLADNRGVFFLQVPAGSVAEKLGIARGQVLLELDGKTVEGVRGLREEVGKLPRGKEIGASFQDQRTQKPVTRTLVIP